MCIRDRKYTVSVIDTELATIYNFEDTLGGQKYYIFVEREGEKVVMEWASGNAGYAMTGVPKTADDYPTFQFANGKTGKCLSLVCLLYTSFACQVRSSFADESCFEQIT